MSVEKRLWRRSPISPLAHSIRMDTVRQANIFPTCRLDKSSRAVYEPEDVWAKKAALVKPVSRSGDGSSWARDMFKQKVLTISTTGMTKANMDVVDRVKEVSPFPTTITTIGELSFTIGLQSTKLAEQHKMRWNAQPLSVLL